MQPVHESIPRGPVRGGSRLPTRAVPVWFGGLPVILLRNRLSTDSSRSEALLWLRRRSEAETTTVRTSSRTDCARPFTTPLAAITIHSILHPPCVVQYFKELRVRCLNRTDSPTSRKLSVASSGGIIYLSANWSITTNEGPTRKQIVTLTCWAGF